MAKKVVVTDKVKIRGIRRRWLINSVGVVLLVLALALGTFSTAMWSYYYSSTMNDLKRRAADDAGGFASFTRSQYWTNAQNAVQKFEDKTKLELQFLDDTGAVQYSSNDLAAGTTPGTQDIQSALNYQEAVAWKGTDPHTGERVVAASAPIVYHGQTVAVVRYVTSLVAIDWQFFLAMGLACLLGAAILALVYFSNLYFVRSIVEPLASITETARLIADGSYGVQIEKKFDDEVGELTDTINDMSLKIKQSEKTQSEFISSVSHELPGDGQGDGTDDRRRRLCDQALLPGRAYRPCGRPVPPGRRRGDPPDRGDSAGSLPAEHPQPDAGEERPANQADPGGVFHHEGVHGKSGQGPLPGGDPGYGLGPGLLR